MRSCKERAKEALPSWLKQFTYTTTFDSISIRVATKGLSWSMIAVPPEAQEKYSELAT
jgi:hypothetical protein